MNPLIRAYRVFKYCGITARPRTLALLSKYPSTTVAHVEWRPGIGLVIKSTEVTVEQYENRFLLEGASLLHNLLGRGGARLVTKKGSVMLDTGAVRIFLQDWQELFIAHEVFFSGVYNVSVNRPFRVIDVGMNVGTTSLFFASNPLCSKIDAFELFPKTVKRAAGNFDLNPGLAHKINVVAAGLCLIADS